MTLTTEERQKFTKWLEVQASLMVQREEDLCSVGAGPSELLEARRLNMQVSALDFVIFLVERA